ncbi:MAG: sel1 repeat family protein [Clostridiales bacterium]|nr:sel1 repeat family protein [Clostridiales bacterium]
MGLSENSLKQMMDAANRAGWKMKPVGEVKESVIKKTPVHYKAAREGIYAFYDKSASRKNQNAYVLSPASLFNRGFYIYNGYGSMNDGYIPLEGILEVRIVPAQEVNVRDKTGTFCVVAYSKGGDVTVSVPEEKDIPGLKALLYTAAAISAEEDETAEYLPKIYYTARAMAAGKNPDASLSVKEQYQTGMAAYTNREYGKAAYYFELAANRGSADGQFWLGNCYRYGLGVDKVASQAISLYEKAARQGHSAAQCWYGATFCEQWIYPEFHDIFIPEKAKCDNKIAIRWWKKSADQGNTQAMFFLGRVYEYDSEHISADKKLAADWYAKAARLGHEKAAENLDFLKGLTDFDDFERAAKRGDPQAQYDLGVCYDLGRGVKENGKKAEAWLKKASSCGCAKAEPYLKAIQAFEEGKHYANGGRPMNAAKCFFEAAEAGHAKAQYYLGEMSLSPTSPQLAVHWYEQAARQGYAEAQYRLGQCYYEGFGVEKDAAQSEYWFRKAANLGHAKAQVRFGRCCEDKIGHVRPGREIAMHWYKKAAQEGDHDAEYALGMCYAQDGKYRSGDSYKQAIYWLKRAAESGNVTAQYNVGILYYNGDAIKGPDYFKARDWMEKAANNGMEEAKVFLKNNSFRP